MFWGLFLDMFSSSKPFFFLYYLKRRKKMQKRVFCKSIYLINTQKTRSTPNSWSTHWGVFQFFFMFNFVFVFKFSAFSAIFLWFSQMNACFAVLTSEKNLGYYSWDYLNILVFRPAFGCTQHLIVGLNTQQQGHPISVPHFWNYFLFKETWF